ncbi:MAG TPA: hypothetical protein VK989_00470 [Polyangia bacterium]|jgi:hypothetical protein|nr:hypothetical protein [Polyangia bacterium]
MTSRRPRSLARWTIHLTLLATATLLGAGCGGSGGAKTTACTTGGTGQLTIAVTGLPAGVTPMVRVTGGGLAAPMVLSAGAAVTLTAGDGYEIDWRRVKTPPAAGSVVGTAYFLSSSSFDRCVHAGVTTTATLTYMPEPGSGDLWMSVSNPVMAGGELAAFAGTDLAASAAKEPVVWKTQNFTGIGGGGAFDSSGDLWVPGGDAINMYAMSALATAGDAAPPVVLTQPANVSANFAAFDSSGNLWVSRGAPGAESSIVRYTPADQMASGTPTPSVVITSADLMDPSQLAFDKNGELWVASQGNDEVLKFSAAHLAASYAGAADVVLTADNGSATLPAPYTNPLQVAFDRAGNLWVGYIGDVVAFTPAQQAASGNVSKPLALAGVAPSEGAFAFDESGGLWMDGPGLGQFQRFAAASLATGGMVTPDITIDSATIGGAESLVFDPAPTWSPINDAL